MSENAIPYDSGKAFAINLKKLRKERGLTQEELGKALGVGKSCISNYEKNFSMPDIYRLVKIANFFCVSDLGDLVGFVSQNILREDEDSGRHVPIVKKVEYDVDPVIKTNTIDDMLLPCINLKTGNFFGIIIPDNSMVKSNLKKGDIAIIRKTRVVSNGEIALIAREGESPLLRRVVIVGETVTAFPDSDDTGFVPLVLDPKKDNFNIVGKVSYVQLTV